MPTLWRNINDLYFARRNDSKVKTKEVEIEPDENPKQIPKVTIKSAELLAGPDGFEFNNKCKCSIKVKYPKNTPRKPFEIGLFSEYNETTSDHGNHLSEFDRDGIIEKELTLYLDNNYHKDNEKPADAKVYYYLKVKHPYADEFAGKKLEMPQKKGSRVPVLTFTDRYTKINAYNLALFAALAYCDRETIKQYFNEFDKENSRNFNSGNKSIRTSPFLRKVSEEDKFIISEETIYSDEQNTDAQFFIAYSSKQVLISVRGTELNKKKDWLQNIKADEVDFSDGKGQVHKGFYECFQFVKREIDKLLKKHSGKEIIITGHSLGGAIATLTAAYIRKNITEKVMLYTFGSPRVGNRTFAEYFSKTKPLIHFRCVNDRDLVTNVPLPGMELNAYCIPIIKLPFFIIPLDFDGDLYSHFGKIVYVHILNENDAIITPDYKKKPIVITALKYLNSTQAVTSKTLMKAYESIDDHLIPNYLSYLRKDFIKSLRLYRGNNDAILKEIDKEIPLLTKELAELKETKKQLNTAAKNHEMLSLESKDDSSLSAFHAKEASDIRYKIATLDKIIADKEFELTNHKLTAEYYRKNKSSSSSILKMLIGKSETDKSIENEIKYHLYN